MFDVAKIKRQHRQNLARLSFDEKIAILIKMQRIAQELALSSGRKFNGKIWCDDSTVYRGISCNSRRVD